jgi:chromosome segregation ATPase
MEEEKEQAEENEAAAGEMDSLKLANETLKRELASRRDAVSGLEKTLAEKDGEIAVLKQVAEDFKQKFDVASRALPQAVAAYKELAVQASPGLVAEMIQGDTIEAVNESLNAARALVERVKQKVEEENVSVRVPAGAPQRTLPDLSALSPREKIKYAMEGKA